jgi:hypothetical protein
VALAAIAVLLVAAAPASANHRPASGRLGPIEGKLHLGHGRSFSSNWSGYAAFGRESEPTTFTQVEGNWVQPEATCNLNGHQYSLAAFWIGLDGFESKTVEQIGTDADCSGKVPVYFVWYELYPQRPFLIPMRVEPGNELHAEVTQNSLFIRNESTGEEETVEYESGSLEFSSAEWIAEKPFSRFTNFGEVQFSGASASDGVQTGPISSWDNESITLAQGSGTHLKKVFATPGELDSSGSEFTITQTP